jgi:uncharacterized protein (TIGR02246 family)
MEARAAVRTAIEQADGQFERLCERKDAAALAELYTEGAALFTPGHDMQRGRDAIAAFWRGAFEAGVRNVALEPREVEEYGADVAREIGAFSLDSPNGRVEGKYIVIWKREAGEWRLDADIWNTNG